MARVVRRKKIVVVVKEETARAISMSVEEAEIKVNAILQRHKIMPSCFLSVLYEDKKVIVCTTRAIIECDRKMISSEVRSPNVGFTTGRNVTGHRLPACSM